MEQPRRTAARQRESRPRKTEPEAVRVFLLGSFRVSVGSRFVEEDEWHLRKAASLVKLLALSPGHRMNREQVMNLLWPDLDPKAAANNFHHALHVARNALEPSSASSRYLRLGEGQLSLCPNGPLWVDVEAFEEAAKAARRAHDPAAYRAATELYAGDLLPRDRYEGWTEEKRAELRTLHLALIVQMARLHEERGEREAAIEALGRVVTIEPTHEEARAELMRLHAASGRRGEALSHYERHKEALAEDLDEEPSTASKRLYEKIKAGEVPESPPPTRPSPQESQKPLASPRGPPPREPLASRQGSPRHNLPAARASFVGRERELVEVKRALATTRLLTLTGAGGCGKTRLALEAARDLLTLYPDGTWLVELAPLSDSTLVPQAFAQILGVREKPGRPLTETLADHLGTKNLMLVVDNCEHLVEAVAALVDALLDACPHLHILATSREALRVAGEVVWPVQHLSVPDVDRSLDVEDLTGYESVRLFVERAHQRVPAFSLTPDNAWSVAEICRRLDGIPLAIELATARMVTLAVEQLAERMDDSLKLLTVGNRTAEPRRRTLRATLDWSHELLSKGERVLFRRLSVFAGGFSLDAAQAVGIVGSIGRVSDVLDLLSRLVEKSLVKVEEGGRYRLLEPVRLYAQERLESAAGTAARPEAQDIRRQHAEHYLAFAEEADLIGPDQAEWLERLEVDLANVRAALSWFLAEGCIEKRTRLAVALGARFWNMSGPSEGKGWLEHGLARGVALPTVLRAKALNELGFIAMCLGDYPRMTEALEEGLALSRELGDERGIAMSLGPLRFAALHGKDHERVSMLDLEAETGYRKVGDPWARGYLAIALGFAAAERGDFERSTELHEEALALFREMGDLRSIAMCLNALGMTALERGSYELARPLFEEDLRLLRKLKEKVGIQQGLMGMAAVFGAQGEPARAARLWGAEEALREALGLPLWGDFPTPYGYEGRLSAARSQIDEVAWEEAWAQGRAMTPEEAIEYALSSKEPIPAPEQPSVSNRADKLTRREEEVALLVARGLTNRQISSELSISENTVANHVSRILKKLDLPSRSQIAVRVTEQRLRASE